MNFLRLSNLEISSIAFPIDVFQNISFVLHFCPLRPDTDLISKSNNVIKQQNLLSPPGDKGTPGVQLKRAITSKSLP